MRNTTLITLCAVAFVACGGEAVSEPTDAAQTTSVEVTVTDPQGYTSQSATQRLFLFDGACPDDEELAHGDVASAFRSLAVPQIGTPFVVDDLDKKKVCFAVMFRKADCAVIAFGATPADLNQHKYITTEVFPMLPPLGACSSGLTCVDGACK